MIISNNSTNNIIEDNGISIRSILSIEFTMLYDCITAQSMATKMLKEGIYVNGFYFPVGPKGKARIRVQISAAMNEEHLDKAIYAFTKVGKDMGIIAC